MAVNLLQGDCRKLVLEAARDGEVDAIVTDPPYELGIADQAWDKTGVAHDPETWEAFSTLLKPGGYVLAFGATRNHHRLAAALEQAGYTIQDEIPWLYAQGYPKREGLLKPANEPIVVARNGGSPSLNTSTRREGAGRPTSPSTNT
jgi:DNA modification methylase